MWDTLIDGYVEVLVKKKTPVFMKIMKLFMIIVTIGVFLSFFLFWNPFILLAGFIMCFIDYVVFLPMDMEFEYLYMDGLLQIDKILSKQKRKKYLELELEKIEKAAPKGSAHLVDYWEKKKLVKDCTTGEDDQNYYSIIYRAGKELWEVRIVSDKQIVDAMRKAAPRKVFLN